MIDYVRAAKIKQMIKYIRYALVFRPLFGTQEVHQFVGARHSEYPAVAVELGMNSGVETVYCSTFLVVVDYDGHLAKIHSILAGVLFPDLLMIAVFAPGHLTQGSRRV